MGGAECGGSGSVPATEYLDPDCGLHCPDLHETLGAGEQPGGKPEQLPAPLLAGPDGVVRQLLHDLAVDLVTENLLRIKTNLDLEYSRQ